MKPLLTSIILLFCFTAQGQKFSAYDLSCNHRSDPIGIDDTTPRLSWKITSASRNVSQGAYSIRVATSGDFSKKNLVWESGKINSDESILVKYQGPLLESGKRYYWQVKVWDHASNVSPWSPVSFWEMGLLKTTDWKAQWIEPQQDTAEHIPALYVRKEFSVSKPVLSARAYITSHGFYELNLNGKKVGDQVLTPGWTAYQKRLQYQVYDIAKIIQQGGNAVGAILGEGWYRGSLGWVANWGIWGKRMALLCQIEVNYTDGTSEMIISDNTWKSTDNTPVVMNGIYDGESYDARKEITGWDKAGFDDRQWQSVATPNFNNDQLVAMETVPVQKIEELKPVKIFRTPKGTLVVDFGQNMVGWVRMKMKGSAGTKIVVKHAEVLDKFGEFYIENLRNADATMTYTLKGGAEETYEPRFTFFGFRFISVDGFPGELKPEHITGVVVHSNMKPTGTFDCSNPLINKLQKNILWGQKGNFVDVPTDCPQRDERLGWTGDAQAFCRTAAFNMNVAAFFSKWLKDLSADQYPDGRVPFVIPDVLRNNSGTSAGWGDVATIAPWTMYQVYGDKTFLENQYPSMKAYVEYIRKKAGESYLWTGGSVFGDWLYYKPKMESHTEPDGYTSPDMIATMFYSYSAKLLSLAAHELNKKDDEVFYQKLFESVKAAFNREYVTSAGRIASDSQTAYVLALMFDLLSELNQAKATQHLVDDIKARKNHLSTGFLGTPYLCHVLSENGQLKVAYDLLLQETFPSWLFPVKMGATTIWERWDGQKTDSTFQDKGMNSFNHYAYGAIGDWMYRVVAGMEIGKPGYKQIRIQPQPDVRLTFAKSTFESSYGLIASGWEMKDEVLTVKIRIPCNTTAIVTLPGAQSGSVRESGVPLAGKPDFWNVRDENGNTVMEIGSGEYVFAYTSSF